MSTMIFLARIFFKKSILLKIAVTLHVFQSAKQKAQTEALNATYSHILKLQVVNSCHRSRPLTQHSGQIIF